MLLVSRSTLSSNTAASAGGGLYSPSGSSASLNNSTVSGNSAETGGGIYVGGEVVATSSTIAANDAPTASALFGTQTSGVQRVIARSLVDGNCAGARFDSAGHNFESPGNTCGLDADSDETGVPDLELGPLEDNGGPTETHALNSTSPAIDAVPSADCIDADGGALAVDQRGEPRPSGTDCDAGSFEAQR
jgi:predicted outer membrane repeat protein